MADKRGAPFCLHFMQAKAPPDFCEHFVCIAFGTSSMRKDIKFRGLLCCEKVL